jgi:hypothetical protein
MKLKKGKTLQRPNSPTDKTSRDIQIGSLHDANILKDSQNRSGILRAYPLFSFKVVSSPEDKQAPETGLKKIWFHILSSYILHIR